MGRELKPSGTGGIARSTLPTLSPTGGSIRGDPAASGESSRHGMSRHGDWQTELRGSTSSRWFKSVMPPERGRAYYDKQIARGRATPVHLRALNRTNLAGHRLAVMLAGTKNNAASARRAGRAMRRHIEAHRDDGKSAEMFRITFRIGAT